MKSATSNPPLVNMVQVYILDTKFVKSKVLIKSQNQYFYAVSRIVYNVSSSIHVPVAYQTRGGNVVCKLGLDTFLCGETIPKGSVISEAYKLFTVDTNSSLRKITWLKAGDKMLGAGISVAWSLESGEFLLNPDDTEVKNAVLTPVRLEELAMCKNINKYIEEFGADA